MTISPARTSTVLSAAISLAALLASAPTAAAQTRTWTHGTEADFREATREHVVVSNTGEIRLSRRLSPFLQSADDLPVVMALAEGPDGTVYVGSGPSGALLALAPDGTQRTLLTVEVGEMVTAVHAGPGGQLLVGVSGPRARLFRVDRAGRMELALAGADAETPPLYVWAIVELPGPDGGWLVATGPHGTLYRVRGQPPVAEVVLTLEEDNLLCLAVAPDQSVLIGTDPRGLVYRFDPATRTTRVLLDTPQHEVVALKVRADGTIFAAASNPAADDTQANIPDRGQPDGPEPMALPEFPDNLRPPPPTPREPHRAKPSGPATPEPTDKPRSAEPGHGPHDAPADALPDQSKTPATAESPGDATSTRPLGGAEGEENTSAVYRIEPEGFASQLLSLPASIRDLADAGERLFIATGPGGQLYELDLSTEEVNVAARADAEHITRLLLRRDGTLLAGTGDSGGVFQLGTTFSPLGTLTSAVLDAGHPARFGMVRLDGTLPEGTAVRLSTRSGNTDEPTDSAWSAWSPPVPVERFTPSAAPVGRYFQYRLLLQASPNGSTTPSVREIEVAYRIPNLPPKVTSVTVERAASETPGTQWKVSWEAEDANGDVLRYRLEYRAVGETGWRPLREKITDTTFQWDTRQIPDGRYQVRVVAEDLLNHPSDAGRSAARASRSFLVDNTPPRFGPTEVIVQPGVVTLKSTVADASGVVREVAYRVGASEEWRPAEPTDTLFDSPQEEAVVILRGLPPGRHVVSLRAADDSGNVAFETVILTVPPAAEGATRGHG